MHCFFPGQIQQTILKIPQQKYGYQFTVFKIFAIRFIFYLMISTHLPSKNSNYHATLFHHRPRKLIQIIIRILPSIFIFHKSNPPQAFKRQVSIFHTSWKLPSEKRETLKSSFLTRCSPSANTSSSSSPLWCRRFEHKIVFSSNKLWFLNSLEKRFRID